MHWCDNGTKSKSIAKNLVWGPIPVLGYGFVPFSRGGIGAVGVVISLSYI